MSKHVTFAARSTDSDEDFDYNPSTPLKVESKSITESKFFLSPGLSPIHKEFSISDMKETVADDSQDNEELPTSPIVFTKDLSRVEIKNRNTSVNIETFERKDQQKQSALDESHLSYLSFMSENDQNRSLFNDSDTKDSSTLQAVSYIHDEASVVNATSIHTENASRSPQQTRHSLNTAPAEKETTKSPSTISNAESSIKSVSSPYLKPGSLFTVVLDDHGQPIFVPIILPNSPSTRISPIRTIPDGMNHEIYNEISNSQGLKPELATSLRLDEPSFPLYVSPSRGPVTKPNNVYGGSPIRMDSNYWRSRLHNRKLSSVLSSQSFR